MALLMAMPAVGTLALFWVNLTRSGPLLACSPGIPLCRRLGLTPGLLILNWTGRVSLLSVVVAGSVADRTLTGEHAVDHNRALLEFAMEHLGILSNLWILQYLPTQDVLKSWWSDCSQEELDQFGPALLAVS